MRGNRPSSWMIAGLVAATLVGGCSSGAVTTPGATDPPEPFVVAMTPPTSAVAATPTPTAGVATPSAAIATPTPTMDPALVGTWAGELETLHRPVERWAVTLTMVGPCAVVDEPCGTWQRRGLVTQVLDWAPWAVLGEDVSCEGQLRYKGMQKGQPRFLAAIDTSGGAGNVGCEVQYAGLTAEADGTVRFDVFASYGEGSAKGPHATLYRVDGASAAAG